MLQVEDHQDGYPRFCALLAAHEPYFICRAFTKLRARVLLLKQDQLSILEQKLDAIDAAEDRRLLLGCSRMDNSQRCELLAEIEQRLGQYGR